MRAITLSVAVLAACDVASPSPSSSAASLPALRGAAIVAASDHGSTAVIDRLGEWARPMPDCVADAYGGIELTADVAPQPGDETVLASFSQGVVVLGADGHRIASARGFDCTGSQDDLITVEVVRTWLAHPLIAVAASQGGRRESATWLELFAVGDSDQLERLFAGEIDITDDRGSHGGGVTLLPNGLLYHHPTEGLSLWTYDDSVHRYVEWRASEERRPPILD